MKKRVLVPLITFNILVGLVLAGLFVLSEGYPLRPGAPVYRVQHAAEQWRMQLTAGQASRAAMALELAERNPADPPRINVLRRAIKEFEKQVRPRS